MALPYQMRASMKYLIPLSAVMLLLAIMGFTGVPNVIWGPDSPVFTSTRQWTTGEHLLNWRLRNAPLWLYQGLHAAPAITWSLLMPLQHIDRFRQYWPTFHRRNGYVVLSISLLLSMTGYLMIGKRVAHTHENIFHFHNLSGLLPIGWPSFELSLICWGPIYLYSLFRTIQTAKTKDIATHRKWAVTHTISAYAISLERVSLGVIYIAGWALAIFPKNAVHRFLRIEDTISAKASLELDTFALANIMGFSIAIWWAVNEWRRAQQSTTSWGASFIAILVSRAKISSPTLALDLFANMYLAGTVKFGGGPVFIPLLRSCLVDPGWAYSRDFLIGFPGPISHFAVFLGAPALRTTSYPTFLGAFLGGLGIFFPGISLARQTR
ncbi:hypothetical protein BJX66DRAFT_345473 [Aspergillus keveii]|uniref:Integral membrane protein n=1 Tax=Aspergillus keveii TaxID=714993 RepID=A0ABR4FHX1_9EURO